jgi:hypothetical protein
VLVLRGDGFGVIVKGFWCCRVTVLVLQRNDFSVEDP